MTHKKLFLKKNINCKIMYLINTLVPKGIKKIDLNKSGTNYFPHLFDNNNHQLKHFYAEKQGENILIEYIPPFNAKDQFEWLKMKIKEFEKMNKNKRDKQL